MKKIYTISIPGNVFRRNLNHYIEMLADCHRTSSFATDLSIKHRKDDRIIVYRYKFEFDEADLLYLKLTWEKFDEFLY